jgi:hypothetical protein
MCCWVTQCTWGCWGTYHVAGGLRQVHPLGGQAGHWGGAGGGVGLGLLLLLLLLLLHWLPSGRQGKVCHSSHSGACMYMAGCCCMASWL